MPNREAKIEAKIKAKEAEIAVLKEKQEQRRMQKAKLARQLEAIRNPKPDRKTETRKKILYGAAILAWLKIATNENKQAITDILGEFTPRWLDREFLGLPLNEAQVKEKQAAKDRAEKAREIKKARLSQPALLEVDESGLLLTRQPD